MLNPTVQAIFEALTSNTANAVFCGLIAVLGFWAILYVQLRTRRVRSAFIPARQALDGVEKPEGFTERFGQIDEELRSHTLIGPYWRAFANGLLPPHASMPNFRSPIDASAIFVSDEILSRALNLRLLQATPSYLTGLGIFGTFVGLVAGITLAAQGLSSSDLEEARRALGPLLGGAGLAFATSMTGILFSICVSWVEKAAFNSVGRDIHEWNLKVNSLVPVVSSERLAAEQLIEQEKQTLQLERFNTELAISIASALDARITDRIVPIMERLAAGLDQLGIQQTTVGEELLKMVGEQISKAMSGAAGEEMRSMRDALQAMVHILREAATAMRDGQSKLVEVTSGVIDRMDKSFSDNAARLRDETDSAVHRIVERLEVAVRGVSTVLEGAGATVAAGLAEASGTASGHLTDSSAKLHTVVDECHRILQSSEAAVQRFDGLVERVGGLMEQISVAHEAMKGTTSPLQATADRLSFALTAVGNQVDRMGSAAESIQRASQDLKNMQETLSSTWDDYEKRFAAVDTALGSALQQMVNGFDLYGEKIRELNSGLDTHLAKALADLSGVLNELHESIDDLQGGLGAVGRR